ncbi:A/G-specific adenine glycosylase [Mycoplasmatota bacterium]|nr:A/G-specific adenine glycosylase [Mycoplasmatota bacterium]
MIDTNQLEKWYKNNKRELPFRKTSNPYYIWVSEIMLQQTQVETVIPYFNHFIKVYPTVNSLANTNEDTLLSHVQGLGYYRRFKNMLKAAKTICNDFNGGFPTSYKDLIHLSGIGEYTAGAIMSIAYHKPFAATDGNVIRVISRVYNINEDMRLEKNKKLVKKINQDLIEDSNPSVFTQALMELGALICRPKNPKCEICPLLENCIAYSLNLQNTLPKLSRKKDKKVMHYHVFIIEEDDCIYLRKRTEKLLGGMYEFPQYDLGHELEFTYNIVEEIGNFKHIFTHLIWEMKVTKIDLKSKSLEDWVKVDKQDLENYPMAKAHRKFVKHLG